MTNPNTYKSYRIHTLHNFVNTLTLHKLQQIKGCRISFKPQVELEHLFIVICAPSLCAKDQHSVFVWVITKVHFPRVVTLVAHETTVSTSLQFYNTIHNILFFKNDLKFENIIIIIYIIHVISVYNHYVNLLVLNQWLIVGNTLLVWNQRLTCSNPLLFIKEIKRITQNYEHFSWK